MNPLRRGFAAAVLACVFVRPTDAAGPPRVALTERTNWRRPINTPIGFDEASRAELAAFVDVLASRVAALDAVGGGTLDWTKRAQAWALANLRLASKRCARGDLLCPPDALQSWEGAVSFVRPSLAALPPELSAWREEARTFHQDYISEQLRLAALFPKTTSEILPLSASEILGDSFDDLAFLLSFDDGPSNANGLTDQTLGLIRKHDLHPAFFVLGDRLKARRARGGGDALRDLYAGTCVGSHGEEHRSHQRWADAVQTLAPIQLELEGIRPIDQPRVRLFRPPFGQRSPLFLDALEKAGMVDVLWNVDSQDWNPTVSSRASAGRVITLMLLWRRGTILFHDIHPKAVEALPTILSAFGHTIQWLDCRLIEKASESQGLRKPTGH